MSKALVMIQNVVSETLARLEGEAASARAAYVQALRAAICEGEGEGVLGQLKLEVAALIVPVQNGYCYADISEAKSLLRAARNAGVITLHWGSFSLGSVGFHSDFSGIVNYGAATEAQQKANAAQRKFEAYREANAAK